jgi:hypothetical protein
MTLAKILRLGKTKKQAVWAGYMEEVSERNKTFREDGGAGKDKGNT